MVLRLFEPGGEEAFTRSVSACEAGIVLSVRIAVKMQNLA